MRAAVVVEQVRAGVAVGVDLRERSDGRVGAVRRLLVLLVHVGGNLEVAVAVDVTDARGGQDLAAEPHARAVDVGDEVCDGVDGSDLLRIAQQHGPAVDR